MFKAGAESMKIVRENLPNAEALLNADDFSDFLDKLSDYLNYVGFDENDDITDFGREIERAYDDFFYSNP